MRKIPTLFVRDFEHDPRNLTREVHPDCKWVVDGEGIATRKYDGTCVMHDDDDNWWARREVKKDKAAPGGFVPVGTDDICVSCKVAGWEPSQGDADAAQVDRGTSGLPQRLVRPEDSGRPLVSNQVEREPGSVRSGLRDLRNGIQGPQGQEDVQQGLRQPTSLRDATEAPGQPEAMASRSGQQAERLAERRRISDGLSAGSPEGGRPGLRSGAPSGDGDGPRQAPPVRRDGAPQERPASGQPAGEPRTVDEAATYRSPAGRNRSLRNVHLCRVCGVEEVTGKTVGWEPIEQSSFAKYLAEALGNPYERRPVGTYELVGPKVNGNPENADGHELIRHDDAEVLADAPRDFDGLAMWLHAHDYEGIVWHGGPDGAMAKIKKRDFRS